MNDENKKMETDYILSQKEKGIDDERIKKALLKAGWSDEFISIGFAEVKKIINKKNSDTEEEDIKDESEEKEKIEEKEKSVVKESQKAKGSKSEIKNDTVNENFSSEDDFEEKEENFIDNEDLKEEIDSEKEDFEVESEENSKIVEYILSQKEKGIGNNRIKKALLKAGWSDESVYNAFVEVKKLVDVNDNEKLEKQGTKVGTEEKKEDITDNENLKEEIDSETKETEVEDGKNSKVVDYIISQDKKGINNKRIKKSLLKAGWDDESISIGFAEVKKMYQEKESNDLKDSETEKEDAEVESEDKDYGEGNEENITEEENKKIKEEYNENKEAVVEAESLRFEKEEDYQKQNPGTIEKEKEEILNEIYQEKETLQKKNFDIEEKKKSLIKTEKDENIILALVLIIIGFLLLGVAIIFVDFLLGV